MRDGTGTHRHVRAIVPRQPGTRSAVASRRGSGALCDEAEGAVVFEDREADIGEAGDLLLACLFGDLLDGQALAWQVALDDLAVLDHDDRLSFEDRSGAREAKAQPGDEHL